MRAHKAVPIDGDVMPQYTNPKPFSIHPAVPVKPQEGLPVRSPLGQMIGVSLKQISRRSWHVDTLACPLALHHGNNATIES